MQLNYRDERDPIALIVDDDSTARFMARQALEPAGFVVHEAGDGGSALHAFVTLHPDIVVLDVMMPVMDGLEACARIRGLPGGAHTPILMLTGLDDTASINRAYEVGATDFATKPVNYVLLAHRLRYLLRAKITADALRESEARLTNAQRIAKLCHWEWEPGHGIQWSAEAKTVLGLPSLDLVRDYKRLLALIPAEDQAKVQAAIAEAWKQGTGFGLEHGLESPNGVFRTVYQEAECIKDEQMGSCRLVGTLQDVTERRRAEKQIERLVYYEKTTGLPNRALLKKKLAELLVEAKRENQGLAILILDLAGVKPVNDSFGRSRGDQVLRQVAKRLTELLDCGEQAALARAGLQEQCMFLGHLGGDEFCVLRKGVESAEDVALLARRIQNELAQPISLGDHEVCLGCSVGISIYPEDGGDPEQLLKHGGAALHSAKKERGNQVKFFTPAMNQRVFRSLILEAQLRKALQLGQFVLHYQPKVDLKDGKAVGVEVLLRWQHPTRGLVYPGEFISVAEETGLIGPLGEWIFRAACERSIAFNDGDGTPLGVAVNISAAQFAQKDLYWRFAKVLELTGADPRCMELEITESLLLDAANLPTVYKLRKLGLRITMDDFGTGYSSLGYLKDFPLDSVKIDRSFIKGIRKDPADAAIVSAVIGLAHSLKLKVVAEGVENEAQVEVLRAMGCDQAQGYYYTRALGATEAQLWLNGRNQLARAPKAPA